MTVKPICTRWFPVCENNAPVKTALGVVSATFGAVEFDVSIFWVSLKMKFLLRFGAGDSGLTGDCPATGCHTSGRPGVQVIAQRRGPEAVPPLVL